MRKESQYIHQYLAHDGRDTLGTFLAYTLRGEARKYSQGYETALLAAIFRRVASGEGVQCRACHGAWRINM